MDHIRYLPNPRRSVQRMPAVERFGPAQAETVRRFHRSFPQYAVTPLTELPILAGKLGLSGLYVKDESFRFGLNAFKVLGGSWAIAALLAARIGRSPEELSFSALTDEALLRGLGEITFVTATDGNHGRGVAWTAQQLQQKSRVFLPKGSAAERLRNIQALGADAEITDLSYDDAVRFAADCAERYGWCLVQDTSWDGYEEVPARIMEGYTTMALEAVEQLSGVRPTHIFLQAGVGAMAGALTGFFSEYYEEEDRPVITVVEPDRADCIFRTAEADDGKLHFVTEDMNTIMAGLACGEPCPIGWEVLREKADFFFSVPDTIAAKGMRLLGRPAGSDPRVVSGESGAVTAGLTAELMQNPALSELRELLGLGRDSIVLCFSTEGDTDRDNYLRIVRDGSSSD